MGNQREIIKDSACHKEVISVCLFSFFLFSGVDCCIGDSLKRVRVKYFYPQQNRFILAIIKDCTKFDLMYKSCSKRTQNSMAIV